jgi:ATP/maltotriose-dependent transcriptional regulator MalT
VRALQLRIDPVNQSDPSVKRHLTNLFNKLGVANRTHAVARARELGLLP